MKYRPPIDLIPVHDGDLGWNAEDLQHLLTTTDPATLPDVKDNLKIHTGASLYRRSGERSFLALLPSSQDCGQHILRVGSMPDARHTGNDAALFGKAIVLSERFEQELVSLGTIAAQNNLPDFILPHSTFLSPNNPYIQRDIIGRCSVRTYTIVPWQGKGETFKGYESDPALEAVQLSLGSTLLRYFEQADDGAFICDISKSHQYSRPDGILYDLAMDLGHANDERGTEIANVSEWLSALPNSPRRKELLGHAALLQEHYPHDADE